MRGISYASTMENLIDAMLSNRLDICFLMGIVSRYQSDPREKHWMIVRYILKYLFGELKMICTRLGSALPWAWLADIGKILERNTGWK